MTDGSMPQMGQPSMGRCLGVFALYLICANVAFFALTYFIPNFPVPSSFGVVLLMLAAITAGDSFAKQSGRKPDGSEKLLFMALASVVSIALSVVPIWGLLAYYSVPFTLENVILAFTGDPAAVADLKDILPIVLGIVALLTLFMTWFGFGIGARGFLKRQEKLAAKAARSAGK